MCIRDRLELLGRLVGCIVMVGVACGGAVVIGFSISGALCLVQEKASDIRERRVRRKEEREDAAGTALDLSLIHIWPSISLSRSVGSTGFPGGDTSAA